MIVNAKQYLKQAYKLNERIESDKIELENLRSLSTSIAGDMTQEKVQSSASGDKTLNIICAIVDLEDEIKNEIEKLIRLKKEIRDVINKVEDVDEMLVLKYRYLMFLQWDEICEKMNYSKRQMYRIHDSALKHVKVLFSTDMALDVI